MYGRRQRVAKVAQYKQSIGLTIIHVHSAYAELPRRSFSDVQPECCETSTVFVLSTQTFVFSTLTSVVRLIATAARLFVVSSKPLCYYSSRCKSLEEGQRHGCISRCASRAFSGVAHSGALHSRARFGGCWAAARTRLHAYELAWSTCHWRALRVERRERRAAFSSGLGRTDRGFCCRSSEGLIKGRVYRSLCHRVPASRAEYSRAVSVLV